ncbi:MAG TPA: hypothetical protein VGM23_18065 [Armatimonadota bacterium]
MSDNQEPLEQDIEPASVAPEQPTPVTDTPPSQGLKKLGDYSIGCFGFLVLGSILWSINLSLSGFTGGIAFYLILPIVLILVVFAFKNKRPALAWGILTPLIIIILFYLLVLGLCSRGI